MRRHPAAQALAEVVERHGLPREPLEAMIDARYREHRSRAPLDRTDARRLAEGTAGGAAAAGGAGVWSTRNEAALFAARDWAALWSLSLLLLGDRASTVEAGKGRAGGRDPDELDAARTAERGLLPVEGLPRGGPGHARRRLSARPEAIGGLGKRMRITWAVTRGTDLMEAGIPRLGYIAGRTRRSR